MLHATPVSLVHHFSPSMKASLVKHSDIESAEPRYVDVKADSKKMSEPVDLITILMITNTVVSTVALLVALIALLRK
jgi:hypothetical protein